MSNVRHESIQAVLTSAMDFGFRGMLIVAEVASSAVALLFDLLPRRPVAK